MARLTRRQRLLRTYLTWMTLRDSQQLLFDFDAVELNLQQRSFDLFFLRALISSRYLKARNPVPKVGNLHLAFLYAENEDDHPRFIRMLRVTPQSFHHIHALIKDSPDFSNNSPNAQIPSLYQLAVTLYRAGRYGNGASIQDVARIAGLSEGCVEDCTHRVLNAILELEAAVMKKPTPEEIEREKEWVEREVGCPAFRDGWFTGDGTLVNLAQKPGLNGDAYFSHKSTYSLNVQVRYIYVSFMSSTYSMIL